MKCFPAEKGVYYLIYRNKDNQKRAYVGVRYPSRKATPLVVLGGKRAKDVYQFVTQTLENCGLKCQKIEDDGEVLIKLPWATGLAASFFLLSVYSTKKPLKYSFAFERMITGEMPLTRHLVSLLNLAVDLSRYFESEGGYNASYPRQMISAKAAKTVSRMIVHFLRSIAPA
jgi:hypothetical protein